MYRKLRSVVAVPLFLVFVQVPLSAPSESSAGLLTQFWHWATHSLESIGAKAGGEMDPNGHTTHGPLPPPQRSEDARIGAQRAQ